MKKFLKSKIGKYFLYSFIHIFVFILTNLLIGWLVKDYEWIYQDARLAIMLFIILNLLIDVVAIAYINIIIDFMD